MYTDNRLGTMAAVGLGGLVGGMGQVSGPVEVAKEVCPPTPPAPNHVIDYDPTVGEMIQTHIREYQTQIKRLEVQYLEARHMGILDKKARAVRDIVGW